MDEHIPELGQWAFSNTPYTDTRTPGYITAGIEAIDNLYAEIVEGKNLEEHFRPGRTSNSGEPEVSNEVFALRSYCWCDVDHPEHENGCPPNFEHFPSGFKAYWYKHAERGGSCTAPVPSRAEWIKIQRECEDWIVAQPPPFRVLVTGSREWASELYRYGKNSKFKELIPEWKSAGSKDREAMKAALREARRRADGRHMVVVEGGALGADRLARMLAYDAENCHVETHPAEWNGGKDGSYDKAAGFKRNGKMVALGADLCLAFFRGPSRGTTHCSGLARQAGIEVIEVHHE